MMGELTVSSIPLDALSDVSESSRDEIREHCGPDVYQERFRVDRPKLEQMMQGENNCAEGFFQKIMENTNTYISWPQRLKVGAKSKKDPHVRIAGTPENVAVARARVLDVLEAKQCDRVNMKIDVSYTDHSHIIGKGGFTIKQVMEATGCHIHFPDSNRTNQNEKSNQVSIAGPLNGAERARASIRRLMPLNFSFDMPVVGAAQSIPDVNSPSIKMFCQQFNVEVAIRQRFKLHATLVVVKGCDWEVDRVKQATRTLIKSLCGPENAIHVPVEMSLEISTQHHTAVLGARSINLSTIMQETNTKILFPDAEDPNIASLKKSNVRIIGDIDQVYLARQQLIGSLPVMVMFDLPVGICSDVENHINLLMQQLDVSIKLRLKSRQSTHSVTIRGIERCVTNVYIATHTLLNLEGPQVKASTPESYRIPALPEDFSVRNLLTTAASRSVRLNNISGISHAFPSPPLFSPTGVVPPRNTWNQMWPSKDSYMHQNSMNHHIASNLTSVPRIVVPSHSLVPMFPSPDSAIHSFSTMSSPNLSPRMNSPGRAQHSDSNSDISSLSDIDRRAPGCERRTLKHGSSLSDFRKMAGYKAMHSKITPGEPRVPTSQWSGTGLSASTPDYVLRKLQQLDLAACQEKDSTWPPSEPDYLPEWSASNLFDSVSKQALHYQSEFECSDLGTLFMQHGLTRYTELFSAHEIDFGLFLTLKEVDLVNLGVDKFGPRRKMMAIIADIKSLQARDSL
ncbi:protein bicaudal C homolog 1-A [Neocloeon triangulifer]|uniref:protein bicaudal C homolog 1-A n=1 Tax=Neocloeon triangulifer TaxID=2078957 RepID=UPI00286F878C|nr:protein bicaudal C homolog 1-A [Neocloeon triangulifer]